MHDFSFSVPHLNARHIESGENMQLAERTMVFNVGTELLKVGVETVTPRASSIFERTTIPRLNNVVLITSQHGFSALTRHPARDELMRQWTHVHDIFPLPHLKNTNLWRSDKERIGNVAFNMWFAAEGTDCGIHNEHDFLEVHTQIWGTGHMQKFHEKDVATLYQDIYMTPGYTHEPFCGADHKYPWHRYYADTDCIWLAVEYYDS